MMHSIISTLVNKVQHCIAGLYCSKKLVPHFVGAICYRSLFFVWRLMHPKGEDIRQTADALVRQGRAKDVRSVSWDMRVSYLIRGFEPCEYAAYHFESKSARERSLYWSRTDQYIFSNVFSDRLAERAVNDKEQTYRRYAPYFRRSLIKVSSLRDLEAFRTFVDKHDVYFIKPVQNYGGKGAGYRNAQRKEVESELREILKHGACVVEEPIKQSELMARFNPDSVNTVRVATLTRGGQVSVLFSVVRYGRKGRAVDNVTAGGLFCLVDNISGRISSDGFLRNTGEWFQVHPESKLPFKDFEIPRWGDILRGSLTIAKDLSIIPYLAFDWAVTDDGPALVEINVQGGMTFEQTALGVGLKERYEALMRGAS